MSEGFNRGSQYEAPVDWQSLYSNLNKRGSRAPSTCSSMAYAPPTLPSFPDPGASFAELQAFCKSTRESLAASPCPSFHHPEEDTSSFHTACSQPLRQPPCKLENPYSPILQGNEADDDDGADWLDLGIFEDGDDDDDGSGPAFKFDFPVPMEPVVSVRCLQQTSFVPAEDGTDRNPIPFYTDSEGYVQVYTQGDCRIPFVQKGAIGVWFGPDHPMNVSERVHSGRRTQEAARFNAVIKAIKVAGNCGIQKLQINTDYINIVRFMMYFIWKWENNGWITLKGTPVRNRVLIEELDYYSKLLDIKWNFVPPEDEAEGNLEADKLVQDALDVDYKGADDPPPEPKTFKHPRDHGTSSTSSTGAKPKHTPIRFNPY